MTIAVEAPAPWLAHRDYTDSRTGTSFRVLEPSGENVGHGLLPSVFIPTNAPGERCDVGECTVTRTELEAWARAILAEVTSSGGQK